MVSKRGVYDTVICGLIICLPVLGVAAVLVPPVALALVLKGLVAKWLALALTGVTALLWPRVVIRAMLAVADALAEEYIKSEPPDFYVRGSGPYAARHEAQPDNR